MVKGLLPADSGDDTDGVIYITSERPLPEELAAIEEAVEKREKK